jgi:hypothetical protein
MAFESRFQQVSAQPEIKNAFTTRITSLRVVVIGIILLTRYNYEYNLHERMLGFQTSKTRQQK